MRAVMMKFVKVLRAELEDLEDDIELLIAENQRRFIQRQESERVCRENVATLLNEEYGIRHFVEVLNDLDVDNFDDLEHLIASIRQSFHDVIESHGLAQATIILADRRIAKAKAYVTE